MKKIKKMNRSALILPVILVVVALVMLALSHSGWKVFFPKVKISQISASSPLKEETTVGGEIFLSYDYTADNKDGKFYLTASGNEHRDFIYLYVPNKYAGKFEKFNEQSLAVLRGEKESASIKPFKVHGLSFKPEPELLGFASDWLYEMGIDAYVDGKVEDHILSDGVIYAPVSAWFSAHDVMFLIFAVIMAGVSVWAFIYVLSGKNLKKAKAVFLADGLGDAELDAETAQGEMVKGNMILLTPRYMIYPVGLDVAVVRQKEIVWAFVFHQITNHKLYGIVPMGKTHEYSVKYVLRNGGMGQIRIGGKEADAKEALKTIEAKYPQVITESSQRILNLANSDFGALIRESDLKRENYERAGYASERVSLEK